MSKKPTLTSEEILALPAVVPVWPTLGQIYGLGKTHCYELARRDELPVPVIRVGKLLRARRIDIVRNLGLDEPPLQHSESAAA